jgi:hypothetical protein
MCGLALRIVPPAEQGADDECMMNVKRYLPFLNRSLAYSPLPLSEVVRISTEKGNPPYNGFGSSSTNGVVVVLLGLGKESTKDCASLARLLA